MRAWIAVALVIGTLAVYGQVAGHEFVYFDDDIFVFGQADLDTSLSPEAVARAFTESFQMWIPLTRLSLLVDRALYGEEPAGFLLTNVALHALAAVLLFLALLRLTGEQGCSAFVAGVFALHPLHVESVAWASERKDVLSGVFFASTLLQYARYSERPSATRYLGVTASFALGLAAKPSLVTLPFVLLLLDAWPLARFRTTGTARLLLEKLPLLALVAAASYFTWLFQRDAGALVPQQPPLDLRFLNALHSYGFYVWKSFWPTGLAVFYPYPAGVVGPGLAVVEMLGLSSVTGLALALRDRQPQLAVGWLWFVGMLVPVLGFVQVGMQARADRYTYLPQIGLAIAFAWTARAALASFRVPARVRTGLGVAVCALLAGLAWQQTRHWRNTQSLFERAVAVTERNFIAHQKLGDAHWRAGRLDEAEAQYLESLRWGPDWPWTHLELGRLLALRGRRAEALGHLRAAAQLEERDPTLQAHTALALFEIGEHAAARELLRAALVRMPDAPQLREAALRMGSEPPRALPSGVEPRTPTGHPQRR